MFRRLLCAAAFVLPLLAGCTPVSDEWAAGKPGPKVAASFAPIQCFAMNVAGEDAQVRGVMTTQGPHHFDPSPSDARTLSLADLFLTNGLLLDDAISKRLLAAGGKGPKHVILGAKLDEALLLEGGCNCGHADDKDGKHDHEHGQDPHVWTGMPHAVKYVEAIRDELKALDAAHAADYDRRAAEYVARLEKLKADGLAAFAGKKNKRMVCFHESLNYFANTYDLTVSGVVEDSPGHAPTPKELEALVATCVKRGVRVIAVEPQYRRDAADSLVAELKRKGIANPVIVTVDPLETCPANEMAADWYEARMRANFAALAGAFE